MQLYVKAVTTQCSPLDLDISNVKFLAPFFTKHFLYCTDVGGRKKKCRSPRWFSSGDHLSFFFFRHGKRTSSEAKPVSAHCTRNAPYKLL